MLEERPKIISVLTDYVKAYTKPIVIIAVLSLAFWGWQAYQKHLTARQTQLQQENAVLKSKIEDKTKEYNNLKVDKDKLAADNVKLDADAQYWKKKAGSIVVPPKPGPAPTEDAVLVSDLKIAGVEFKPIPNSLFSTERESLPIVWTWNKERLRVPGLEEKLAATEQVALKFEDSANGLKAEVNTANKMLSAADKREALRIEQEKNLNDQIKTEHKKAVAAELNGWLKFGGGLLIGYAADKALRK
jgi:FtsZ-binding cell division protein ZapB